MSLRFFGIFMLFWVSALFGVSQSLNKSKPLVMAETAIDNPVAAPARELPRQEQRREAGPAIRVILPSPYEVRTN